MVGSEGADSPVWRVPLAGDDLPDVVAARRGSPSPSSSGPGGPTADATGDGDGKPTGSFTVGALVLLGATALVIGLRKVLRRGR